MPGEGSTHPHGGKRARRHVNQTPCVSNPWEFRGRLAPREGVRPLITFEFPGFETLIRLTGKGYRGQEGLEEGTCWGVLKGAGQWSYLHHLPS